MSSKLIKNNKNRYEKEIVASRNEEVKLRFIEPKDSDDEAIQIANQIKSMVEKKVLTTSMKTFLLYIGPIGRQGHL